MGFKLMLCFLFFSTLGLPVWAQGQQPNPATGPTGNQNSKLVLNKIWTNSLEGQVTITSAFILLGPDQKFKTVEVNANQLEKTDNIWRPTTFSFDLNGTKKGNSHLDDEFAYVSPNGKRISFNSSGWKTEDSEGNLLDQSSEEMLKENLVFSQDDSLILGRDDDDNAAFYDAKGNLIKKIEAEVGGVWFSPDSQFMGLISRNPKKPKLKNKFSLLDHDGNLVFELPLDSKGVACSFNDDVSQIFLVSDFFLYVIDMKGNIVSKTALPHRDAFGPLVFIKKNSFVTAGLSNVWKGDLSSGTAKFESLQKIDYARNIQKIGNNFVVIYGIGKAGPYSETERGIEILSPIGKVLATAKLDSTLSGIQVEGDYLVVWSNRSLSLFKVSAE
jgi:hypothetical protein